MLKQLKVKLFNTFGLHRIKLTEFEVTLDYSCTERDYIGEKLKTRITHKMDSMPFCIGLIFILTWTKACVRQACVADYPTGVTTWMQLSWLWCQKKKTEYQPVDRVWRLLCSCSRVTPTVTLCSILDCETIGFSDGAMTLNLLK